MDGASCDAEIGGALGVDYFVSASVLRSPRGLELGVTLLRIGRDVSLLRKDVKVFHSTSELLDGVSAQAELVTRAALDGVLGGTAAEEGKVALVNPSPRASVAADGMVPLPGGTYTVGTGRSVTVQPFLLDVTAVTVAAYEACVKAGRCAADELDSSNVGAPSRSYCNWGKADRASHPVNCVDWNEAGRYCASVGKRLPTADEREWAARGAERGTKYPWGNDEPRAQLCWNGGSVQRLAGGLGTCEVGSFPAGNSPQGLRDLAGNVAEWTSTLNENSDPVTRGGSWVSDRARQFAAASRDFGGKLNRGPYVGFRCARTP
jgi:formylglycine-generating enzyme required for sulfatase activity